VRINLANWALQRADRAAFLENDISGSKGILDLEIQATRYSSLLLGMSNHGKLGPFICIVKLEAGQRSQ